MTSSPAWDRLFPLLEHSEHAASIAVVTRSATVTYGELVAQVSRIGDALAGEGLPPGALIGLSASTKARWTSLYALCDRYGWVAVPMDPNAPAVELARLDSAIGLSAVIAWGTTGPGEWPDRRPLLATVAGDGAVHVAAGADDGTEQQQRLLDQAVIFPTSGSTGGSKQVVLSRTAIINGLDAVGGMWQLGPGVRVLEIAPLWLFAGYQYAMAAVRAGGTVVALEHLEPDGFLAATRDEVRGAFMVPTHARLLRDAWRTPPARIGLREILFGGERFEPELQHWLETTLPGTDITVEIGISEVGGQVSYLSDAQRRKHPDAAGHVFTGASLHVRTDAGEIAATGTGRLLVRTDRMMTGYFQTLGVPWLDAEGRYQTEDTVRIDEDGLIHHLGRSSSMIRVGAGPSIPPRSTPLPGPCREWPKPPQWGSVSTPAARPPSCWSWPMTPSTPPGWPRHSTSGSAPSNDRPGWSRSPRCRAMPTRRSTSRRPGCSPPRPTSWIYPLWTQRRASSRTAATRSARCGWLSGSTSPRPVTPLGRPRICWARGALPSSSAPIQRL